MTKVSIDLSLRSLFGVTTAIMPRFLTTISTVAVSALIAGCGNSQNASVDDRPQLKKDRATTFSLGDTVDGLHVPVLLQAEGKKSLSLDELRGSVVVLEFWATWCGPCISAIGHLNEVADEFSSDKNFRFISITDEDLETVSQFLAKKSIHTWIGLDEKELVEDAFGVSGIPETIVINADGKVAARISPKELSAELLHRVQRGEIIDDKTDESYIQAGVDPSQTVDTTPIMQIILRETSTPSQQSSHVGSSTSTTILARDPQSIISHTFDLVPSRTVFEVDLPEKKFDLITRFPSATEESKQVTKLAVASAFNVATRKETRLVDVFILGTQKDGSHSLAPTVSTLGSSAEVGSTIINVVNGRPSNVLPKLESKLLRPVIDETSLEGSYDFAVKFAKDSSPEEFAKAFTDATGLTITPAKRELEFTIVVPASP